MPRPRRTTPRSTRTVAELGAKAQVPQGDLRRAPVRRPSGQASRADSRRHAQGARDRARQADGGPEVPRSQVRGDPQARPSPSCPPHSRATYPDYKTQAAGDRVDDRRRRKPEDAHSPRSAPSTTCRANAKTPILKRGDYTQPGREVGPGVLQALATPQPFAWSRPAKDARTSGRRLAFAKWLTQPGHPLTARVMVNRIWLHHFGEGIVSTPDNFGTAGAPPSHPELLDWLASEFVARGWSIKAMHRLILTSTAYRQSSRFDPRSPAHARAKQVDPDDRLLWRQRMRRLEAEPLRDAMLAASGTLEQPHVRPARAVRGPARRRGRRAGRRLGPPPVDLLEGPPLAAAHAPPVVRPAGDGDELHPARRLDDRLAGAQPAQRRYPDERIAKAFAARVESEAAARPGRTTPSSSRWAARRPTPSAPRSTTSSPPSPAATPGHRRRRSRIPRRPARSSAPGGSRSPISARCS